MADNKKSFILYTDLINTVSKLPNEKAGELFKIILEYVNDNDPIVEDLLLQIAFEPVKSHLKRDLKKYNNYIEKQKENGKKGGRPKKEVILETEKTQPFFDKPKKADSVNDSVSVIDNDNVIVNDNILLKKETKKFSFKDELIKYGFNKDLVEDWLKVRKTKKATNTKTSFNGFIKEIEKQPCNLNEILEVIVQKNWSGFKWQWLENEKFSNNGKGSTNSKYEITKEIRDSELWKRI